MNGVFAVPCNTKPKGKFFIRVVRQALLYGAECWLVKSAMFSLPVSKKKKKMKKRVHTFSRGK